MSDLAEVVRDVLVDANGRDPWEVLSELGLTTIGVPEDAGGPGGGLAELAQVVEALAENGSGLPVAEHAVARWAAGPLAPGVRLGTVVLRAGRASDATPVPVPWGGSASHVVVARLDGSPAVLVDLSCSEVVRKGFDVAGRPLDEVVLPASASSTGCASSDCAVSGTEVAARLASLRAAAIVGAGRGAYRLTRSHVTVREQFGRPLVQIPAVTTALARLRIDLLQAEAAADNALRETLTGAGLGAAAAGRVVCGDAATRIAETAHRLHGALGVTQEYALQSFSRLLWMLRDVDLDEEQWAVMLGELAVAGGESTVWEQLTMARAVAG